MWCWCFVSVFLRPAISLSWILSQKKVYCQHNFLNLKVRFIHRGLCGSSWKFYLCFKFTCKQHKDNFPFPTSGYAYLAKITISHCSPVGCLSVWQLTTRSTELLKSWFWPEFKTLFSIFLNSSKNIVGYNTYIHTYMSLNRILAPDLDTNDPLYVVNIYQVSFCMLLHKELSVLEAYCRGQTSKPTSSACVCLKPYHTYEGIFLLLLYISDTFLWSAWHILHAV